jgi:hypothetical protein
MRENRPYGSEGGGTLITSSLPLSQSLRQPIPGLGDMYRRWRKES